LFESLRRVLCAGFISLSLVAIQSGSAIGGTPEAGQDGPAARAETIEDPGVMTGDGARILLYGDSFTMGFSGDWTWRYRLWRHLTATGALFDFVGPRNDMREYVSRQLGSQGYRDPNFDRDHAAVGGMTFSHPWWEVSSLVDDYQPDVVVGLVGTNDLFQRLLTPEQLTDKWRDQIELARSRNPEVGFVLVQVPVTWYAGVREYNSRLVALANELDTAQSRVVATELAQFDPYIDTYDHAHPTASGERKFADAVSAALASIGVGSGPAWDLVDPSASTAWAPTPRVAVKSGTLTVSWDAVDYASAQDVHVQDVNAGDAPADGSATITRVAGTTWSTPVASGHRYRVWLAPVKGLLPMGTASTPVTVLSPTTAVLR
jgi:lysophospholipase L1-like esterase